MQEMIKNRIEKTFAKWLMALICVGVFGVAEAANTYSDGAVTVDTSDNTAVAITEWPSGEGAKVTINMSAAFNIESTDTSYNVATIATSVKEVSPSDFALGTNCKATGNTYIDGIEVKVATADDTQTVTICRKSYVWMKSNGSSSTYWDTTSAWSDNTAAGSGKDYLICGKRQMRAKNTSAFPGDSLTVMSNMTRMATALGTEIAASSNPTIYGYATKQTDTTMSNFIMGDGGWFIFAQCSTSGTPQHLKGNSLVIVASDSSPAVISTAQGRPSWIDIPMSGSGTVVFRPFQASYGTMPLYFTKDNSAFTGRMYLYPYTSDPTYIAGGDRESQYYIGLNGALGGNPAAFDAAATIVGPVVLYVTNDVDMTSYNYRGITVDNNAKLAVSEGKTFKTGAALTIASDKTLTLFGNGSVQFGAKVAGAGTLAVNAGTVVIPASTSGNGLVVDGAISFGGGQIKMTGISAAGTYPLLAVKGSTPTIEADDIPLASDDTYTLTVEKASDTVTIGDETYVQFNVVASAATVISEDTTWDLSGETEPTKTLTMPVIISSGRKLTITGGTLYPAGYDISGEGTLVLNGTTVQFPEKADSELSANIFVAADTTNVILAPASDNAVTLEGAITGSGYLKLNTVDATTRNYTGVYLAGDNSGFSGTLDLFAQNTTTLHKFVYAKAAPGNAKVLWYSADGSSEPDTCTDKPDTTHDEVFPFREVGSTLTYKFGTLNGNFKNYRLNFDNLKFSSGSTTVATGYRDENCSFTGAWQSGYPTLTTSKSGRTDFQWHGTSATCDYSVLQTRNFYLMSTGTLKISATDTYPASVNFRADGATLELANGISMDGSILSGVKDSSVYAFNVKVSEGAVGTLTGTVPSTNTKGFTKTGDGTLWLANVPACSLTVAAGKVRYDLGTAIGSFTASGDGKVEVYSASTLAAGVTCYSVSADSLANVVENFTLAEDIVTATNTVDGVATVTTVVNGDVWKLTARPTIALTNEKTPIEIATDSTFDYIGELTTPTFIKSGSGTVQLFGNKDISTLKVQGGTLQLATVKTLNSVHSDYDPSDDDSVTTTNGVEDTTAIYLTELKDCTGKIAKKYKTQGAEIQLASDENYFGGRRLMKSTGDLWLRADVGSVFGSYYFLVQKSLKTPESYDTLMRDSTTDKYRLFRRSGAAYYQFQHNSTYTADGIYQNGVVGSTIDTDAKVFAFPQNYMYRSYNADDLYSGGSRVAGEMLVLNRTPYEYEIVEVSRYLMNKWSVSSATYTDLPTDVAVEMASGATLDLSGQTLTVQSFRGAGTVSNGSLLVRDGTIYVTGDLSMNAQAGKTYAITAPCASLTLTGAAASDAISVQIAESSVLTQTSYTLTITCAGTVTVTGADGVSVVQNEDGTYAISRSGYTFRWNTTEGDWSTIGNWQVLKSGAYTAASALPTDIDRAVIDSASTVIVSAADATVSNLQVSAAATLRGDEAGTGVLNVYEVTGNAVLSLTNANMKALSGYELTLTVPLYICTNSVNTLVMNGKSVNLGSNLTGSGTLQVDYNWTDYLGLNLSGDNREFGGTLKNINLKNYPIATMTSANCTSSNAVWYLNANRGRGSGSSTAAAFPVDSSNWYYFGALRGMTWSGQNTPKVEIGHRTDVESSFAPCCHSSANGYTIRKVGSGRASITWGEKGSANSKVQSLEINEGTVYMDFVAGSVTFSGPDTVFQSSVDASGAFKNNTTYPIVFDDQGTNRTWLGTIPSSNTAGFTKKGSGTLTLAAAPAYTGATTVEAGKLIVTNGTAAMNYTLGANTKVSLKIVGSTYVYTFEYQKVTLTETKDSGVSSITYTYGETSGLTAAEINALNIDPAGGVSITATVALVDGYTIGSVTGGTGTETSGVYTIALNAEAVSFDVATLKVVEITTAEATAKTKTIEPGQAAVAASGVDVPIDFSVTVTNKTLKVDMTGYYDADSLKVVNGYVKPELDEDTVEPITTGATMTGTTDAESGKSVVAVSPGTVKPGLYYKLAASTTNDEASFLADTTTSFTQATSNSISLTNKVDSTTKVMYYKVLVSDTAQ